MEWVLLFFLIAFALLAIFTKPMYGKLHYRDYDPKLFEYLKKFDEDFNKRTDYYRQGGEHTLSRDLDKPNNWQKALITAKETRIRAFANIALAVYAVLLILSIQQFIAYSPPVSDFEDLGKFLKDWGKFLAQFSVIAVLYWRHRRSFVDGTLQGYLNGYMDASEHFAMKSSNKVNTTEDRGPI